MAKPSKSQRRASPQRASSQALRHEPMRLRTAARRRPLRLRKAVKGAPVRLRTKVFWIISTVFYAASVLVPATMGIGTWMMVDIVLVPILAVAAFAVILGDQTPDGSILSSQSSDSGGSDCSISAADC